MTPSDAVARGTAETSLALPIRDAATLILIRREGALPRVLMGRRHAAHAFMPGKFVFPGGRLDPADARVRPVRDLDADTLARLQLRMRGRPSAARARGLGLAAVRETFEEAGLILGAAAERLQRPPSPEWAAFFATGHAPDLSGLMYFARAITPPGRARRFDSRFFVADAGAIANPDAPLHPGSGELLESCWFTFDEALALALPSITRDILTRLRAVLDPGGWPDVRHPVSFQFQRRNEWFDETL